ncbi:MAG: agmatinase [Desulfurivibrio sp.]|nr:agmatinase [Desulfurivibrio sp.]
MEISQSYPSFLGEEAVVAGPARIAVLSAPLANTVSWGGGTEDGPAAILAASPALEVFDDELLQETVEAGIVTRPPLALEGLDSAAACQLVREAVSRELELGLFPVLLGGEHTVSGPAVMAVQEYHPNLHVVQVDAHLDLRNEYAGTPLSHACVMRRIAEAGIPFSQVGIRSFAAEEWQLVRQRGWQPFTMARIHAREDWLDELLAAINGPVYLTVDVDGLDPAIMPATGTPVPDGLYWPQLTALARALATGPGLVGLDVCELAPRPGSEPADFTVAKFIYRTLGYVFPQSRCC